MSALFYTKRSRVSRVRAITDTDTGDEKRTGEVPTLEFKLIYCTVNEKKNISYILETMYTVYICQACCVQPTGLLD